MLSVGNGVFLHKIIGKVGLSHERLSEDYR